MQVRPEQCDRAREYASRRLDGELGELERHLLRAHLSRCPECREFEGAISAQTRWLRSQKLERLVRRVEVPRRRVRVTTVRNRIAVAAAFALALVGSLHAVDVLRTNRPVLESPGAGAASSASVDREFKNARRANLATHRLQPSLLRQIAASE